MPAETAKDDSNVSRSSSRPKLTRRDASVDLVEDGESSTASLTAAAARAFLIGKVVMLPKLKLKAAGWFQPEDHASKVSSRLQKGRLGWLRGLGINYGGIYASGVLLFETHAMVLRRLKEGDDVLGKLLDSELDEDHASASKSAIAGACGGLSYALSATPLVSLLRLGGPKPGEWSVWWRDGVLRPLRFTVPRDVVGFGLYFGLYSFARRALWPDSAAGSGARAGAGAGADADDAGGAGGGSGAVETAEERAACAPRPLRAVVTEALPGLATALLSGAGAGVATYLWRSPWDTLYKKRMGWRAADAPLLSAERFVASPRGLKAVGISAATWLVYEAAVLGVRELTARGVLREPEPP